jgi:hypothetical protein
MDIKQEEVAYKKKVGKYDGSPVFEVGLKGGLHLIFATKNGKLQALGAGPHRAVARHIAKKKSEDKIDWMDLNKSDHIEPEHFADILPEWEAYTDALRERG